MAQLEIIAIRTYNRININKGVSYMVFNIFNLEINDNDNCYEILQKDKIVCYYRGFLYSRKKKSGIESAELLLNQYVEKGQIDFNKFYGAYHFIIIDKDKKNTIFFGDNAGNCCFYYNNEIGMISDSFLELSSCSLKISPNYEAITEFIHFNCIYSDKTICKEILRTDAMNYYESKNNIITIKSKDLVIWNNEFEYEGLNEFMADTLYSADGLKIVDIITGGTDSRAVLSHLVSLGGNFELAISGRPQMRDVQIAKEIAEKLNKEIHISDEDVINSDEKWLKELFISTDGVTGTFSRYRLYKKNLMIKRLGFQLEFEGVAGELYKNSFLNQDFPFYKGKDINKNKFYKIKVNPSYFNSKYLSDNIIRHLSQMEHNITSRIFNGENGEKSKVYFRVGSKIIRDRLIALSNSDNLSTPSISPLLEIDMIKLVYNVFPWKLEMNKWHRNEVSRNCPTIARIRTDRGITLRNSKMSIIKETILSYTFLFKVGLKRILHAKKEANIERLEIFVKGRELPEFTLSMNKCKELDILNKEINIEEIPDNLADRLMTVGLVFMKFLRKNI